MGAVLVQSVDVPTTRQPTKGHRPKAPSRPSGLFRLVEKLEPGATLVVAGAAVIALASRFMETELPALVVLIVAIALGSIGFAIKGASVAFHWHRKRQIGFLRRATQHDETPCYLSDGQGQILYANPAARDRPSIGAPKFLADYFADLYANPWTIIQDLRDQANLSGAAKTNIASRRGTARLSVNALPYGGYLWRLEPFPVRDHDTSLAAADGGPVPLESGLPSMIVSGSGAVLQKNGEMSGLIGADAKSIDEILGDLPLRTGEVHEVITPGGSVPCMVAEIPRRAGRFEVVLLPGAVPDAKTARDGWSFFDELPVALVKFDAQGSVIESNRRARELLHLPLSPGTKITAMFDSLGRSVLDWLKDAARGKNLTRAEFLRVKGPKDDVVVQVGFNRVKEKNAIVLIAVISDATELKSLENQFVQSQKMQAIGQLAGGVAHDFNNLLTAISGHCDLLLLRHSAMDQDHADLMQISQNANRAAALVSQLLAFSRKQDLQPEILDLRDVLSDMGHLLGRLMGETVTMTQVHPPELPMIRADKRQLEQVLMNLIVNAKDAMQDGGLIEVSSALVTLTDEMRRGRALVPPGDYTAVYVKDQGTGIRPEIIDKIFDPFVTTKGVGKGTGLGLSTAYGIIKQSGGYIFVDSVVGEGTTFTLYFPALDSSQSQTTDQFPPTAEVTMRTAQDDIVLLVEDEAPVRAFAARALRLQGMTVLEADSGEAALQVLDDDALHVDVFVTDVVMPGIDGPSWVAKALETRPDVRVIFVSGYARNALEDQHAEMPNATFLQKPFSLKELTEVVSGAGHP